jgi:phosphoribosylformylglycinamidine synthase
MDLKQPGNLLFQVGLTRLELGGTHFALVEGLEGGDVPKVDVPRARDTFQRLHAAIQAGLVRACHDLSEGGLAAAVAEMAFAGECGAEVDLAAVPRELGSATGDEAAAALLFAESNTRFVCEVPPAHAAEFSRLLGDVPHGRIGSVTGSGRLVIRADAARPEPLVDEPLARLKEAWQAPLRW